MAGVVEAVVVLRGIGGCDILLYPVLPLQPPGALLGLTTGLRTVRLGLAGGDLHRSPSAGTVLQRELCGRVPAAGRGAGPGHAATGGSAVGDPGPVRGRGLYRRLLPVPS